MTRRNFLTLLGAVAVWPLAGHAQQPKLYRVGALLLGNSDAESFRTELREGLRKSGYIEGQNLLLDIRTAEGRLDLLPRLAAELVALKVDVIVALYTPCVLAAHQATREIPIVALSGDLIGTGLVASLARPGRQRHRHVPDGRGTARQMCGIVPRSHPIGAPRRHSVQRQGSVLETSPGAGATGRKSHGYRNFPLVDGP